MCYYDNFKYACGDWKWGNLQEYCNVMLHQGETCDTRMVYQILPLADKCVMCEKIERKQRRLDRHKADHQRWAAEPHKYRYSLEKASEEMKALAQEIQRLMGDKLARYILSLIHI